jgi:hypothetical protein
MSGPLAEKCVRPYIFDVACTGDHAGAVSDLEQVAEYISNEVDNNDAGLTVSELGCLACGGCFLVWHNGKWDVSAISMMSDNSQCVD